MYISEYQLGNGLVFIINSNGFKLRDVIMMLSVIGARDKHPAMERLRKPRNLQPSPIYFNNQEPAMRMNSF